MSRVLALAGLLAAVAVALLLRAVGWELVFVDPERVVFTMGDAWYHLHRGLHSLHAFPGILWFDSCLNHPDGAVVPWAPLWPWLLAGAARLTGAGVHHYEVTAAWLPVLFGAATLLPIYLLAVRLRSGAAGVGAAAIYASLPIAVEYGRVGNADYHAAIAFVGAGCILLYALALDPRRRGASVAAGFAALAVLRFVLVFLWFGSPVYLAPGELAVVLTAALLGRRDLLLLHAASALGTAALLLPLVALSPEPTGGPWSSTETSWFHVAAFAAAAGVSGVAGLWEGRRPAGSPLRALTRLCVVGLALCAALLLLPGFLDGLQRSAAFVGRSDDYVSRVLENFPLLHEQGRLALVVGEKRLGGFLYLFPLAPLGFLLGGRPGEPWPQRLYLAGWTALLCVLTFQQLRYANELGPTAAVGATLLLARAGDALVRLRLPRPIAVGSALLVGTLAVALAGIRYHAPQLRNVRTVLGEARTPEQRLLRTIGGSQLRFLEEVAALTPRAGDCEVSAEPVAEGVLAHASLGPGLHYVARRAAPLSAFGPYAGRENYTLGMDFFRTESEEQALEATRRLRTPYVLTAEEGSREEVSRRVAVRLHRSDGSAGEGMPHLERFRLLGEGPQGGVPIGAYFGSIERGVAPYKLFEVVAGAVLEVPAEPGGPVEARVRLRSPAGRAFDWVARGRGGPDGLARIRVPYATRAATPQGGLVQRGRSARRVDTRGPWTVTSGSRRWRIHVPEAAVSRGLPVPVAGARTTEPPPS